VQASTFSIAEDPAGLARCDQQREPLPGIAIQICSVMDRRRDGGQLARAQVRPEIAGFPVTIDDLRALLPARR
jgi:hypothetical protein